jgi:hypothetical protein
MRPALTFSRPERLHSALKEGVEGGVDVDKLLQQVQPTEAEHGASLRRNG